MGTVICRSAAVSVPVERVLRHRDVSRTRSVKDVGYVVNERAPRVMGGHRKPCCQSLFKTTLQGVIDRRCAIAAEANHASSWIDSQCAIVVIRRQSGVPINALE